MDALFRTFERIPAAARFLLLVTLLLAFAALDRVLGQGVSSKILFVLPVVLAGWSGNRRVAYLVALLTTAIWHAADLWSEVRYAVVPVALATGLFRFLALIAIVEFTRAARLQLEAERRRADRDPLTGLLNGRGLELRAAQELARARRYETPIAVAFIDLDNFKAVNDSRGHHAGDLLLIEVAALLKGALREMDLVARTGGDEFVLVLPETGLDEAETLLLEIAGRLRERFAKVGVTLSAGVCADTSPPDLQSLLREADARMYASKRAGKNSVCATRPGST